MAMDRSEYPGMLSKLQPGQAVDILNDRVRQVGRLNTAIADWLQERSRLEEQYAAGLRRLARKPIDDLDLGIFSVPWGTITNSMENLADAHSTLAAKVEVDVERPLREFATGSREMQAVLTTQGNLSAIAKEVERAQQKTDKLQGKGERAESNRVANASSDLDNARVQWDTQAPYVFESLQAMDETRINQLRDLLTQFQTLEIDQVEKNRVAAEQCLNVLLNVETQDEIKTFAIRAVAIRPNRQSRSSMLPAGNPIRVAAGSNAALSTIASNTDDDAGQPSASASEPPKKSGFGKGLKRLGTVIGRRGNKQPAPDTPSNVDSPERKSKALPFGRLGRSKDSYSLDPPMEESSQRPQSPFRMGSEVLEPQTPRRASVISSEPVRSEPEPPLNGTSTSRDGGHQGDLADLQSPNAPSVFQLTTSAMQQESNGFHVPPSTLDPISQAQADAAALERQEPQYNVNIRTAPIEEERSDAALASMATKLQAPPPTTRRTGTVRGRRDARNSAVITSFTPPDSASPETVPPLPTHGLSDRYRGSVASATAEQPVLQRSAQGTTAGGMELHSASYSTEQPFPRPVLNSPPSMQFGSTEASIGSLVQTPPGTSISFNPLAESQSSIRPSSRAAIQSDYTGDNQSIRSGHSTISQSLKHPDLNEPGLNSSIVETVSARFDNGQLNNASLVGEIALAFNGADFPTSLGKEAIRLDNFSTLEKVAPNPAFITQSPSKDGEYLVNLSNITRTQVAFKYQLRQEDAESQVPLLITQASKIEPSQISIIISYALHPSFAVQTQPVTLHNVTIALTLEGAKATGCLSKPVGTFAREKNMIYWQLNDLTLTPGAASEKLLARFSTEGEAKGGSIDAKWEIVGDPSNHIGSQLAVSMAGQSGGDGADPFADEDAPTAGASWKPVPQVRKLASGSYVAKS